MSPNSHILKIADLGKVVTGKTPPSNNPENFGQDIPFVTPTDFGNYIKNVFGASRYLSKLGLQTLGNKLLPENSILVSCIGSDMGKVVMTKIPCVTNQQINSIIPDHEIVNPDFLYYKIVSLYDLLRNMATGGSTMPIVNKSDFENIELECPPIAIQCRIAAILTALDDKIELNRRMNETLEGIVQAVWGEWFGKTVEENTNLVKLESFIKIKHGFAFKGDGIGDIENENILLTPGNFSVGGGFNEKKLRYFEGVFPDEYVLSPGDLIVTMTDLSRDGDTLGYPAFVPNIFGKKMLHNQRIGLVEFKTEDIGKQFLYELMRTENYRNFVLGGATGSTVRHTSPGRIGDFSFKIPDDRKVVKFEAFAATIQNKIEVNNQQSRTLTALRDALLPRLMRGD